jgi:uncharacterized alkaline shock family protein YloU
MSDKKIQMGSIHVHREVISGIIHSAIDDFDNIFLARGPVLKRIIHALGRRGHPAIKVTVDHNNEVRIDLRILVKYGVNIPDAAREIQEAIRQAIEKTTNLKLTDINIHIQGLERGSS